MLGKRRPFLQLETIILSIPMPWTVTIDQPLVLDSELLDYYCLENEKDFVHMSGK